MPLYGIDVHPHFQAGLNIEQVRAEGFDFMAVKLSEATAAYPGQDWIRRGKACGLLCLGYHYLRPGNEAEQARVFADQLIAAGVPGMLDAEALASDGKTATLNVIGIHRFLDNCAARGVRVPLLYLPKWYWQRMGSPDLSGLPMLWASSYVNGNGFASELYDAVTPSRWTAYGNLPVAVLQFTDKASVAGKNIDVDAFLGTRDQFVSLIGPSVVQPAPVGPESIPSMEYGQRGDFIARLQDWCNKTFPAYSALPVTGFYGPMTVSVIREFQHRVGITDGDGRNVGDRTKAGLWEEGYRP